MLLPRLGPCRYTTPQVVWREGDPRPPLPKLHSPSYGRVGSGVGLDFAVGPEVVILGEFAAELIWSTYSMLTQSVAYSISFYNRAGWLK